VNNTRKNHNEGNGEVLRQETITLLHFEYEVPALYVADGEAPYIPVTALSRMLGIRYDTRIARWRTLLLWEDARKLPLRSEKSGRRVVWCLPIGAVSFLFSCFDWKYVNLECRQHMRQMIDECVAALDRAHKEMAANYTYIRRSLFEFLTVYADFEPQLARFALCLHIILADSAASKQLETLLGQGRALIDEATAHARGMLLNLVKGPVVDVVSMRPDGEVIEEFALPFYTVVPREDNARFFAYLRRLTKWDQDLTTFLEQHGLFWDKDQKTWHML
jgi:hypothetical protein